MNSPQLRWAMVMVAGMALGGVARAQEMPRFRPSRDVAVTYVLRGAPADRPQKVAIEYGQGGQAARIDFFVDMAATVPSGSTILDQDADSMTIVVPQQRAFYEQQGDAMGRIAFMLNSSMRFEKLGSAMIAGIACTRWKVTAGDRDGTSCVTEDGVLLQAVRAQPTPMRLEATAVTYAEQPPPTFRPPSDFTRLVRVPRQGF